MPTLTPADFPVHAKSLGAPLLSYILNIEVEEMGALLLTGGDISLQQKAALDQAEQVLVQAKNGRINN